MLQSPHGCRGAPRFLSASSVTAGSACGAPSSLRQAGHGVYELPSLRSKVAQQRM